jgi:hypothetical protein
MDDAPRQQGTLELKGGGASHHILTAENAPFFLVGAGRSGTTLLRLILAGHSGIEIPPETWFILPLVQKFPLRQELTPAEVRAVVDIAVEDYRWPDMGIAADDFRQRALALAAPGLADIINLVYRHHLALTGKRRLGDKTPPYIEIVRELAILYPGAKFIHLVRDGRDVATSYIELKWHGGCRCYERNFDWTRALRFREAYRHSELDRQILDVRYEQLVSEPEPTVRRICAFLGEAFQPGMLEWTERTDRVPARERSIHPKLGRPLSQEAIGTWRSKLSAFECFIMEACLQKDLRRWGYGLRFASAAWRPVLVASGWLLFALGPLLARVIPYLQRRQYLSEKFYI